MLTGEFATRNRKCIHFNIFSIVSLFFIILLQYKFGYMIQKTKKFLILIVFSLTAIVLKAQNTATDTINKKFYYEQGINCTQFVKQYLSFNETFNSNMPYLLTGNIGFKKIGLRYGTNYQISNSKNNSSSSSSSSSGGSTSSPPLIAESNSINIDNRVGFYYRKMYFNRLSLNIGIDFLISNALVKTKNESTQVSGTSTSETKSNTKTTTNSKGYGPFMALNYKVWKNISLGTEAALYYISGTTKQEGSSFSSETSSFLPYSFVQQEVQGKTTFKETQIRIPLTLFVYFKF
jgi:hypothetical protein